MLQDASIPRRSFLSITASVLAMVRPRAAVPAAEAAPHPIPAEPNGEDFDPTTHTHYFGYSSKPIVSISGGGGSGATATATVTGGKVTSISVASGGGFTA